MAPGPKTRWQPFPHGSTCSPLVSLNKDKTAGVPHIQFSSLWAWDNKKQWQTNPQKARSSALHPVFFLTPTHCLFNSMLHYCFWQLFPTPPLCSAPFSLGQTWLGSDLPLLLCSLQLLPTPAPPPNTTAWSRVHHFGRATSPSHVLQEWEGDKQRQRMGPPGLIPVSIPPIERPRRNAVLLERVPLPSPWNHTPSNHVSGME